MKKTRILAVMAAMAMALSACGNSTAEQNTASADVENNAATVTEKKAETSKAAEEITENVESTQGENPVQTKPLIVYLNDFDDVIADMFKEATGYDVEVVSGNSAEIMSRIAAEKGNPQWDVVWIDSMYDVYNLAGDGELMTDFEPENAVNLTDFSKTLVPENKCMYPTDIHAAGVLVYRNDVWSEADAPKTFADLTDEKYKDQVGMADPGVAALHIRWQHILWIHLDWKRGKNTLRHYLIMG